MNHVTSFEKVNEGLEIIARHRKDARLTVTEGEISVTITAPRMHPRVRGALRRRGWVDDLPWSDGDTIIRWRWRG